MFDHPITVKLRSKDKSRKFQRFLNEVRFIRAEIQCPHESDQFFFKHQREQNYIFAPCTGDRVMPNGITFLNNIHILFIFHDQTVASCNRINPGIGNIIKSIIYISVHWQKPGILRKCFTKHRAFTFLCIHKQNTTMF